MDNFINMLKEYNANEQTITKFKEKLNEPIEYKTHLAKYEFTEKWFSNMDYILVELGYRALDADIKYIVEKVKKLLLETNINIFIDIYNRKHSNDEIKKINDDLFLNHQDTYSIEIVEYLIKNPHLINADFSKNTTDTAVNYLIEHPEKLNWKKFSFNSNDTAVNYLIHFHPDKIYWWNFSQNTSDLAVCYCLRNLDKIDNTAFLVNENLIAFEYFIRNADSIEIDTHVKCPPLINHMNDICKCINNMKDKNDFIKSGIKKIDKIQNMNCLIIKTIMEFWKIYVFSSLNWLPMSNIIISI